jgi:hypothetical protein
MLILGKTMYWETMDTLGQIEEEIRKNKTDLFIKGKFCCTIRRIEAYFAQPL